MIEPLQIAFDVQAPTDHAFEVWTAQIGRWWPADHTTTGEVDLEVSLEPRTGGRIFEQTTDGREFDWGEVLVWEPPVRLVYSGTSGATGPPPPRSRSGSCRQDRQ